jgi:uncharacterized membrane protein YfcA
LDWVALCIAALLIGISKAGFGGGTGILVGPALTMIFGEAKKAVGTMLPLLFACDVVSLYPYWRKWDNRNVIALVPGAIAGVALGTFVLGTISDKDLARIIGAMAIGFALLQIYRDWVIKTKEPLHPAWWLGVLVGFGTGFVSTLSHVGGLITSIFLLAQRLDNERFVGTTTAVYFLINLAKIPAYVQQGLITADVWWRDLPLFPVVFAGTALGVLLNRRVPGAWFSLVVLAFVLVTGIWLVVNP